MKYFLYFAFIFACFGGNAQTTYRYKDKTMEIEQRVQDLLAQMTLEEKVGQLLCPLGWEMYEKQGDSVVCSEKFGATGYGTNTTPCFVPPMFY